MRLEDKYKRALTIIRPLGSAAVAYSGGADSALLASLAFEALGENAVAVTADTPSLARSELEAARRVADTIGIRHLVIKTHELSNPAYTANPVNRCYFCKSELFGHVWHLAHTLGLRAVLYGATLDDRVDWRPGRRAAEESGVLAPLEDAGFSKAEVRGLSRRRGLPTWDKPASPCLASRIPYGSAVTTETLGRIEQAEEALKAMGFRELRVRHHGEKARVELAQLELARLEELGLAKLIDQAARAAGYTEVEIDPKGLRSGKLNEAVFPYPGEKPS